jgi:hypothetical protein
MAVACLYPLIIFAITCPVIVLAWLPDVSVDNPGGVYLWWPYWVWLAVMFVCQLALLVLPVHVASRRPVKRRPLIMPVIASGLMVGLLVVATLFTLGELRWMTNRSQYRGVTLEQPIAGMDLVLLLLLPCAIWAAWAVFFYFLSRRQSIEGAAATQSGTLLTGSILELLVAVPTHIVARHRSECCAGGYSFFGLCLGISVMLFAFGPSVFFLYLARWRRLQSRRSHWMLTAGAGNFAAERWHGAGPVDAGPQN